MCSRRLLDCGSRPLSFTVRCKVRTIPLIAALLAWASAMPTFVMAEDTTTLNMPRLSPATVSALATVALRDHVSNAAHYDAAAPHYDPKNHLWVVFYRQNGPPL